VDVLGTPALLAGLKLIRTSAVLGLAVLLFAERPLLTLA
jgi:hypothetical protein